METASRKVYYKDDNFTLEYEIYNGDMLLHCQYDHWSPSALRRGYSVFADLMKNAYLKGYDRLMTVTPNPKFAKLFGGDTVEVIAYGGIEYEVIVWDLKQQP